LGRGDENVRSGLGFRRQPELNGGAMKKAALPLDAHLASELHFGYELRETSGLLLKALKRRIAPHGITLTQYFLLRQLWEGEGINQSELSERLATTQPATAKGRTMRSTLLRYAYDLSLVSVEGVRPAEVAKLRSLLARVRENLEGELAIDEPAERGA
jgi:hypothetical protein